VQFPLYLRVPGWCERAAVTVNGTKLAVAGKPHTYIRILRRWSDGDRVALELPMKISIRRWTRNHNSASVDRGPLTYSLKIGEKNVREGGTDKWPAWEIHPTTPWNYGLVLDAKDPAGSFEVVKRSWSASNMPFTHEGAPIELKGTGKKIPQWQLDHLGLVGKLQPSPVKSDEPVESIALIPMGAARLRIASFPVVGDGPEANEWTSPPEPAYRAKASHCWGGDTERAVADGLTPSSSSDGSIPRFTWWDHRGSMEWIQAEFEKPRKVSKVEVYWFDDTGRGHCRVPSSWRLFCRQGEAWKPVETDSPCGVEKDRFNEVTFAPVATGALRIEAQLQDEFSGGILEWRVE
jgi:hypothetical protein